MIDHLPWNEWGQNAAGALLAAFGGLLGYIMREHDKGNKLIVWRAVTEALSSGFVGFLVMLLCQAMDVDARYSGFIVGVFGWLGASASIRLLERLVRQRLGLPVDNGPAAKTGDKDDA